MILRRSGQKWCHTPSKVTNGIGAAGSTVIPNLGQLREHTSYRDEDVLPAARSSAGGQIQAAGVWRSSAKAEADRHSLRRQAPLQGIDAPTLESDDCFFEGGANEGCTHIHRTFGRHACRLFGSAGTAGSSRLKRTRRECGGRGPGRREGRQRPARRNGPSRSAGVEGRSWPARPTRCNGRSRPTGAQGRFRSARCNRAGGTRWARSHGGIASRHRRQVSRVQSR